MTYICTCECGKSFRDKNALMADELYQQHRDEMCDDAYKHRTFMHTAVDDVIVKPGPKWRPADDAP